MSGGSKQLATDLRVDWNASILQYGRQPLYSVACNLVLLPNDGVVGRARNEHKFASVFLTVLRYQLAVLNFLVRICEPNRGDFDLFSYRTV